MSLDLPEIVSRITHLRQELRAALALRDAALWELRFAKEMEECRRRAGDFRNRTANLLVQAGAPWRRSNGVLDFKALNEWLDSKTDNDLLRLKGWGKVALMEVRAWRRCDWRA